MKKISLGKTGLEVSRVGMGGIPIQRPPFDEAVKVINRALDLGVNFIDTSLAYGDSEERIGEAITGRRDEVILATKGRELKHIDMSLKRLNTDYIDLWQFHNLSSLELLEQVLGPGGGIEDAKEALRAGKIGHIGFSSHNLEVAKKAVASGQFETVQFPFNFISNEAVDELLPLARKNDVGFIGMKPFAGGNILDANLAIKYVLQFENVVPDPGIEKVEEIEEIIGIVNGSWELTRDEHRRIEEIHDKLGTRFCRQCLYCMPCPQGVNIWFLMITQGMFRLWPLDKFFEWMKEPVESGSNCIQCGECEQKCPYHLPIREMIKENIDFYEKVVQCASATGGKHV
ncbi:MAG: aldo/keto reductase [Candidatus Bathyarchaeota archaeon]|nr:aldo/keto reductase [Candidatus Bathyarchaeota archaeon]